MPSLQLFESACGATIQFPWSQPIAKQFPSFVLYFDCVAASAVNRKSVAAGLVGAGLALRTRARHVHGWPAPGGHGPSQRNAGSCTQRRQVRQHARFALAYNAIPIVSTIGRLECTKVCAVDDAFVLQTLKEVPSAMFYASTSPPCLRPAIPKLNSQSGKWETHSINGYCA